METKILCSLSPAVVESLVMLAYRDWAEAFDFKKHVQQEMNDGSPDWKQFHATRMANAEMRYTHALKIRDEISQYSALTKL